MILGVGLGLGMPDHFLGIPRFAVDHRGDLPIAAACVKADPAAVEMPAHAAGRGNRAARVRQRFRLFHLKGPLINGGHKVCVKGALAAGLDVGVYFFSQALTEAEAREEAAYTLELIAGYDLTFPVVFDWEQVAVRGSRTLSPDWAAVTDCTEVFCDAVAAAGYTPMTYFNMSMAYLRLDLSRLQKYHGWLAWYHEVPEYRYEYRMWQYGALTTVAGINGLCDVNLLFGGF